MRVNELHSWQVSTAEAREIQSRLAAQVSRTNGITRPRYVAGADISADSGRATAAVVVLAYPELQPVETKVVAGELAFPYVPGLLSFREAPLILAACQELTTIPDLIIVDGQGIAHPRRFGIACHLGLLLDTPAIGCAKSLLCGDYEVPGDTPGSYAEIVDGNEVIGAALRTRLGVKPVFVSIGHKVDLASAVHWVMACCRGYRLPEPTRLAHRAAKGSLKQAQGLMVSWYERTTRPSNFNVC